jgi:sec-independent protein translocase protein TatB
MFDIGFLEMLLVGVVGLLVLGPERLPTAVRTVSLWVARLRRSFNSIKAEISRELRTDEIKREIHNDAVMRSLKNAEQDLRAVASDTYDIGKVAGGESQETRPDEGNSASGS